MSYPDEGQDFMDKLVNGFKMTKVILHIYMSHAEKRE